MGTISRSIAKRAARYVLARMVDLHVPLNVEYLQGNAVLIVPSTFAKTLIDTCEEVTQALADGKVPGGFV